MKNSPKISIVIPSFNKARYISRTINSIIDQKYKKYEVIIQDGGSTDGTLEIIKKFAVKYPSVIKYESEKDSGQLDAVNKGIQKSNGEIITFINADDCYSPGSFYEISMAYFKNPRALWFAGKGKVVDANEREIAKLVTLYKSILLKLNLYPLLLTTNYLMQPSVFITSKAYLSHGPFTGTKNFITEYDLWLKLAGNHMPVVINKNLSFFRIEPTTKTKTMFNSLLKEDERIVKKYTNNPIILHLHRLNNYGRKLIGRFV